MYTKWTTHCKTPQEKIQFEVDVRRAKPVLERLMTIFEEGVTQAESAEEDFNNPSWAYKQAYLVGRKSALKDVIKLIDLDKQKDNTNE